MNTEHEIDLVSSDVTCHVEGCTNSGIAVRVSVDRSQPRAICGACMEEISDIKVISD